jgi:hypothetical protein
MTERGELVQEWWLAVRSISDLVNRDGVQPEEDQIIRAELSEQGFSDDGIRKAMDWLDKASLSGRLTDSLGMLQPIRTGPRIDHALEKVSVHPRLLGAVDICRRRGWLSQDVAERLLEGLRAMDSRDWDRHEIDSFLADVLGLSLPGLAGMSLAAVLGSWPRHRYN